MDLRRLLMAFLWPMGMIFFVYVVVALPLMCLVRSGMLGYACYANPASQGDAVTGLFVWFALAVITSLVSLVATWRGDST